MISEEALDRIVEDVKSRFDQKPKVAIAGFGKAGKSSLFNAIYGSEVAKVSMRTDETRTTQTEEVFGLDLTDTPGFGTERFSLDEVVEKGAFDQQQVVIHLLNGVTAISADDQRLHRLLERSKAKRITAVNKVDLLEEREQEEYAASALEKLGLQREELLFVSAKEGIGIERLIEQILERIPEAMQDAFIAQQQGDLALKERRVRKLIYAKAAVAAGVAAVPIPVADMTVLIPLQLSMVVSIGHLLGFAIGKARAVELIATVGAGYTLRQGARQLLKLIPGFGSVISSGVAFAGTVALGETALVWFKRKMQASPEELRAAYERSSARAKAEAKGRGEGVQQKLEALRRRLEAKELTEEEFQREVARLGEAGGA